MDNGTILMDSEIKQQITESKKLIISGATISQIKDRLRTKYNEEQIEIIIDEVLLQMAKATSDCDVDAQVGIAIERLNMLFLNALKLQDYKNCLAIQREINGLIKLNAIGKGQSASDKELGDLIGELKL
jgi:hypothetical protein